MYSFSVSTLIRAPRSAVWAALTQPELVKKYFFDTNLTTDWRVGSPLTFRGEWNGQAYEDRGTVLTYEPERSLAYDYWSSFSGTEDMPEHRQIIRFGLTDAEGGILVTLEQSNIDTQERADHSKENWLKVLTGLKDLVEGGA
jgi:uncharacterized protein YndB with AHSA1/START domain